MIYDHFEVFGVTTNKTFLEKTELIRVPALILGVIENIVELNRQKLLSKVKNTCYYLQWYPNHVSCNKILNHYFYLFQTKST